MNDNTKRQPAGIPVGGQFAANEHDEAGAALADAGSILEKHTFVEDHEDNLTVRDGLHMRPATSQERDAYSDAIFKQTEDERKQYAEKAALAQFFQLESPGDAERMEGQDYYGLPFYEIEGEEWLVGTEEQAQEAACSKAKEDVWAVTSDFLERGTGIDAGAIRAIQSSMYENAGEPLRKIVESTWDGGLDAYAEELVEEDGRGHTLSGYDGEEEEQSVVIAGKETKFFLYRYS